MGYRGRLINPLVAELAQLDTSAVATAADYDLAWRTPKLSYDGTRQVKLSYRAPIRQKVQVEQGADRAQQRTGGGNVPDGRVVLIFAYFNLEAAGLVDVNGQPMIRPGDKLLGIYTKAGTLIRRFAPELYAVEVADAGLGLGGSRNLLAVTFEDRPQGIVS